MALAAVLLAAEGVGVGGLRLEHKWRTKRTGGGSTSDESGTIRRRVKSVKGKQLE